MTKYKMVGGCHQSMDMRLSKLQKMVKTRESWHAVVHVIIELDIT